MSCDRIAKYLLLVFFVAVAGCRRAGSVSLPSRGGGDNDSASATDAGAGGDDTAPGDPGAGDPFVPSWTCDPSYQGTDDGCDCGCGRPDPDCAGGGCAEPYCNAAGCAHCYDDLGSEITCGTVCEPDVCTQGDCGIRDDGCGGDLQCGACVSGYLCEDGRCAGAVLSWEAPTTNADGTSLTDLAGFRVHWGTTSAAYNDSRAAGMATNYAFYDLSPGTYFFAVTAYDYGGNESILSAEVTKTIP